jgi:hypothetical protein
VDGSRLPGGRSATFEWTVPKTQQNLQYRTSNSGWSTLSPDGPRVAGATRIVRGLHADSLACTRTVRYPYTDGLTNHLQQKFDTPKDLRANSQELDEHAKNTDRTDSSRPTGGQSAMHE